MPTPLVARRSRRPGVLCAVPIFEQPKDRVQFGGGTLELLDSLRHKLLGFGKVVGVIERILFQPLEAIELELLLFHLTDVELAPTVLLGIGWPPLASPAWIRPVALLKLGEVLCRKRPILLCDAGNIG